MTRWIVAVAALVACGPASSARGPSPPSPEAEPPADRDDETPIEPPEGPTGPTGNARIRTFDEAKKALTKIYVESGQRTDLYCGCAFLPNPGHGFRVDLGSCGYTVVRDADRAGRIEWEHAVAASAFGHGFAEWRDGHPKCVDARGKKYKGRKCARAASAEFARMEGDLHNLFPVVGEVNGLRGDLPMGVLDGPDRPHRGASDSFHFGKCASAIERGVFLPRPEARGDLARAAKYMDRSYPDRHLLDDAHRAVFDRWDASDPPDGWERARNERIAAVQGNPNPFIVGAVNGSGAK